MLIPLPRNSQFEGSGKGPPASLSKCYQATDVGEKINLKESVEVEWCCSRQGLVCEFQALNSMQKATGYHCRGVTWVLLGCWILNHLKGFDGA